VSVKGDEGLKDKKKRDGGVSRGVSRGTEEWRGNMGGKWVS
jgi:hypothetical protein